MRKIVWLVACGLLFSGMCAVGAGQLEDSAKGKQAETPAAHLEKAKALLHTGEYEAATVEYRQALKLDPKLQEARQTLARIEAGASLREKNFSAAEEAQQQGEHRLAVRFYTKLLESDALAGARYPLFVTYYNRGNSYLAQRDAIAAIKDYDKAVELNPEHVTSYYNRGSAYSMLGKYEAGIADYSKVIELQPVHIEAYFYRANAYAARREYRPAIADYEKALELNPGWEKAQQSLLEARSFQQIYGRFKQGIAAEKRGDYDDAASIYSEVLDSGRLDPKNAATIYYARARIHKRKGDYPATISDLQRAINLNPKWLALQKTLQAVEAEAADIEQRLGRAALVPPREEGQQGAAEERPAQAAAGPKTLQGLPRPGSVVVDCAGCPKLVVIPYDLSGLIPPIAVGVFELTIAQWNSCVDEGGCGHRPAGSEARRGDFPVTGVNWDDVHTYLSWLSQKSGHTYRLLSESEWEYAARAGSSTKRYWGDSPQGCEYANGADQTLQQMERDSVVAECSDGQAGVAPVGGYRPNRYGLYDTLGNVAEWVEDCPDTGPVKQKVDGVAECSHRVVRGGSWKSSPEHIQAEARLFLRPDLRSDTVGLRLARELSADTEVVAGQPPTVTEDGAEGESEE